jgi:hypothetical protein
MRSSEDLSEDFEPGKAAGIYCCSRLNEDNYIDIIRTFPARSGVDQKGIG